ncbi:NAC domain-containing protein 12-like [Hibiscus syriacus]|uniref:NAC domain-containing protein 12-like n=1 Tax=Hibiscus syriacus TaxID=106335 RepID=A0A6A3D0F2_HIBSY|nr:uncharacterized protein LOC120205056 [Hibiscus syriacus]KAE8735183.1 NAC domain-containing protein 12-like [Hibiscus syriacus]
MGNCLFGGLGEADGVIKVITSNSGVMEFSAPIIAGTITDEFPGHAIFRTQDLFWKPLFHQDELLPGESYYLLPLNSGQIVRQGHVRHNNNNKSGFWKVKLVITPEQLLEILSQEGCTQELIESVRAVAKCGNRFVEGSVGFSDQWSLSSSRNASSTKDGFLLDI